MENKRGFTLVELLAVVVILGILLAISIPAVTKWIERSRTEKLNSQRKTLVMAAENYVQDNTEMLPKKVGEKTIVKAKDLKLHNYLKSDIIDASKRICTEKSYVEIYKKDQTNYTYSSFIYCEGDKIPDEET